MCSLKEEVEKYIDPIIEIIKEDLNKNLSDSLYRRFENKSLTL